METKRTFLNPQTLAKLKGLRLRARRIVEGYVAGLHRSPYQGFSIEFAEHREYAPGDDLRYLDWKVFGRTDKFYLKQFEDETNLLCYIVLDISESMHYRSDPTMLTKLEFAQCLAASLAWLVLHQQDAVGLVTYDSQLRANLRPSSRIAHFQQFLQILEQTPSPGTTSSGPVFHELAERFTKRGVVILISDLFDDVDSLMSGLKHFRHRRHDVCLWHVLDPAEPEFPFSRPTLFRGLEKAGHVTTDPSALRRWYLAEMDRFLTSVRQGCRRLSMHHELIRTDADLGNTLSRFLSSRRGRPIG